MVAKDGLTALIPPDRLTTSSHPSQSLKKLLHGRIDLYIDIDLRIRPLLQTPEFKNKKLKIAGELEAFDHYAFLHQRHAKLALKLAEVIRQMKSEKPPELYLKEAIQVLQHK